MRSAIIIPLALSLALHAGLAWFASRVTLPRRDTPISANLTIGLTVLPTTLAAPEAPNTTEQSATSGRPAELKSDAAPAASIPSAPPKEARAIAAAEAEKPPVPNVAPDSPSEMAAGAPVAQKAAADPPKSAAPSDPVPAANSETPPSLDAKRETPAAAAEAAPPTLASPDAVSNAPAAPDLAPTSASATEAMALQDDGRTATAPTGPVPEVPSVELAPAPPIAAEAAQGTPALSGAELPTPALQGQEPTILPQAADSALRPADEGIATAPVTSVPDAPGAEPLAATSLPELALQSAPVSAPVETATPPQQAPTSAMASQAPTAATVETAEASAETVASAEVADPEAAATVRRATAFVDGYDGGPCVYVAAERIESDVADVDGFATSADAFGEFHQAFAATAGFEPAVTGQKIWKPQCPAVDLLRKLHAAHAVAPALHLDTVDARGGLLHGSIRDPLHRPLHLYWISEAGVVRDLSAKLAVSDEGARFTLDLARRGASEPLPQMLLVLAGDAARPNAGSWDSAAAAFDALLQAHGAGPQVGAAAKLFLLRD